MSYVKKNWQNTPSTQTPLSAENLNHMDQGIYDANQGLVELQGLAYGPLVAATAADMTDQTKVYVYTGSEAGYVAGNWYYYNGSSWVSGGVYNAVAVSTDKTLSISDKAADAKETGKAINAVDAELKNEIISQNGYVANKLPFYIDSNNKWTNSAARHVMIPVQPGDSVYVKANNSYNAYMSVLTEFDIPTANSQTPKYSTESGFTSRKVVTTENDNTFTMPSDAAYIAFNYSVNGNVYYPSAILINGIDVIVGAKEQIAAINADIFNQSLADATDLDTVTHLGYYRLGAGSTYPNQPVAGGRRMLIVSSPASGAAYYQMLVQNDTGFIFTRTYHDEAWDDWANGLDSIKEAVYNQALTNGTDLDTIITNGYYRLGAGSAYPNQPVAGGRRLLFVSSKYPSGAAYQILFKYDTGEIFMRMNHDDVWDPWKTAYDATATKIALGSNPYRKTLDHGGFYDTKYGKKLIYQNSPESFITSMREGIVFHNLDIVFSSDGVPFVSHDVSVPETGGTTININNLTYAQIKQYYIGDQDYSWKLQTLAECASFIKKIGGMIDMVDVTAANNATQIANAGNLPQYYRDNNIKPTWTNFDYDGMRDAFITNGPEFGLYFVCNSEATILSAIAYVQAHPEHKKYLMNIGSSTEAVRLAIESRIGIVSGLGITMYAYTYNKNNVANVPRWADGVVSENCNVNYENWLANMP